MPEVSPASFTIVMTPFVLATKLSARLGVPGPMLRLFIRGSYPLKLGDLDDYTPDERDVFVATFVKSGTNWAMQIAQQIAWLGEAEFEHIHDVVPWPEARMPGLVPLADTRARDAAPTGLRVIKTHASLEHVPDDPRAKYVCVIRDPKDVVVSSYHFMLGLLGVKHLVSPRQWAALVLTPGAVCANWVEHTASVWARREQANVLVQTFVEMRADPRAAIEAIAALMGVTLSESQLERVLERSTFTYMRAHESQFRPPKLPLAGSRPAMIRRGQSGASSELLEPEERAAIDEFCRTRLRALGSTFPYDETFGPTA